MSKVCRVCSTKLVLWDNWSIHHHSRYDYRCLGCTRWLAKRAASHRTRKGVIHTITKLEIRELDRPEVCPVLGTPLDHEGSGNAGAQLDRIVPELGYVPGNVRWISARANRLKDNATLEELRLLVADAERIAKEGT